MATFVKFKGDKTWMKTTPREVRQLEARGEDFTVKQTGSSAALTGRKKKQTLGFDGLW